MHIPDVEGDDFESLLPTVGAANFGQEGLEFLASTLIRFELGLNHSTDDIVSMVKDLPRKSNPDRRISRRYEPDPRSIMSGKLRRRDGR